MSPSGNKEQESKLHRQRKPYIFGRSPLNCSSQAFRESILNKVAVVIYYFLGNSTKLLGIKSEKIRSLAFHLSSKR